MTIHRPVHQGLRGARRRVAGADARGTYRVMMRERAEMVMRVQTGEVSGVGLHTNEAVSASVGCLFPCSTHALRASNTVTSTTCTSAFLISEPVARCHLVASGPGMQLLRSLALPSSPTHALTAPTRLLVQTGLVAPRLRENYKLCITDHREHCG